jgi:hypothetical protein
MRRIYIAGASSEKARIDVHAARVQQIGYTVVPWSGEAEGDTPESWRAHAEATFAAIKTADVFWLIAPRGAPWSGRGACVELGLARASGIESLYSGRKARGVLQLARCFITAPDALRYLYERLHGHRLPPKFSEAWWPRKTNGTNVTEVSR